jgi:hypothetical protein
VYVIVEKNNVFYYDNKKRHKFDACERFDDGSTEVVIGLKRVIHRIEEPKDHRTYKSKSLAISGLA